MNDTICFAQQELTRYMKQITGEEPSGIALSVRRTAGSPFDDTYGIDVKGGGGTIWGCCPRSLLIAVYRFLFLIGCRFFLPGKGGECIPHLEAAACSAKETRTVPLRHRGICIEGSVSREHVLDMIDWLPKAGFNSYFIQFRTGHNFFDRYYTHEGSCTREKEPYSLADSKKIVEEAEREIAKRSLIYHKVGHGWTCEAIGCPSEGWYQADAAQLPAETRQMLAEVDGKREFFGGIPLNTHLCYSNPMVRRKMVQEVVSYAKVHRNISVLHIWLADNFNNTCTCDACRQKTPTDWYMTLLNEIDAALTEEQLDTKLVFLIYFELLWPPVSVHLLHPERFILMFAPITRTYTRPFYRPGEVICRDEKAPLPIFKQNHMVFPSEVKENLAFLYHWQKEFSGDSFDFDYHLMWDIYREFGGLKLSAVIYEDCKRLREMGLNGLMSCQLGRASFPSGLPQYVLGRTLFDPDCKLEELISEYAEAAYPEDPGQALAYLELLSNGFSQAYMRHEEEGKDKNDYLALFSDTACKLKMMEPDIVQAADAYDTRPWKVLRESLPVFMQLTSALKCKAEGVSGAEMKVETDRLRQLVSAAEEAVEADLDVMYFNMMTIGFLSDSVQEQDPKSEGKE